MLLCAGMLLAPLFFSMAVAEGVTITIISEDGTETILSGGPDAAGEDSAGEDTAEPVGEASAREAFIDGIIGLARKKFDQAKGKAQRAQYSGDIYVCKNFTVYLFRENRGRFRMAEYPGVPLVIPDNQKKADCKPYVYGVEWKEIPASEGNPFYVAASFRYDEKLSKKENRELARDFLKQARRGDYFQMAAKYYYGTGAHSMIFIEDYDPDTDSVHWTDSNMKGKTIKKERYGYVQYDAVKQIDWFVEAFCRKSYGATIYRLRDDIVYAP